MRDASLITPLIPFTPQGGKEQGLAARLSNLIHAPARWIDERRVRAELAELSEREWLDMGAGTRTEADEPVETICESEEERAQRARAIRAWYADSNRRKAA